MAVRAGVSVCGIVFTPQWLERLALKFALIIW